MTTTCGPLLCNAVPTQHKEKAFPSPPLVNFMQIYARSPHFGGGGAGGNGSISLFPLSLSLSLSLGAAPMSSLRVLLFSTPVFFYFFFCEIDCIALLK